MNVRKSYFISAVIILIAIMVIMDINYIEKRRKDLLNDSCTTVLEFHSLRSDFAAYLNTVLVLRPDETGYMDMTGRVETTGNHYVTSRTIKFSYLSEGDNIYYLEDMSTDKYASDNTPDNLMNSVFFSISKKGRYMTLEKINNGYIVGNLHSPVLICVAK